MTYISPGVLEGEPVWGMRPPLPEGYSGWKIFAGDGGERPDLTLHHTYHITAARPELARYLALPYGCCFDLRKGSAPPKGIERLWRLCELFFVSMIGSITIFAKKQKELVTTRSCFKNISNVTLAMAVETNRLCTGCGSHGAIVGQRDRQRLAPSQGCAVGPNRTTQLCYAAFRAGWPDGFSILLRGCHNFALEFPY